MTYTFAKAQGGKLVTLFAKTTIDLALDIIAQAKAKGVNLCLELIA